MRPRNLCWLGKSVQFLNAVPSRSGEVRTAPKGTEIGLRPTTEPTGRLGTGEVSSTEAFPLSEPRNLGPSICGWTVVLEILTPPSERTRADPRLGRINRAP